MVNENMIKFLRGNVANLPETATAGALYFTKDEGIYLGLDDGSYHRYGDYIMVDTVANLPTDGANATALYYCISENILARYDSVNSKWVQINKQPTAEEMKTLLGLGSAAYTDASAYDVNGAAAEVRAYVGDIPDGYTEETIVAYINKKAEETLNSASGGSSESAASVLAALNTYKSENDPKVTANTNAIAAIKDGTTVDSFADVETALDGKVDKVEGYSLVSDTEIARLADVDNYDDTQVKADIKANADAIDAIEADYLTSADKYDDTSLAGRVSDLETASATHALKTDVESALALKADKTTVDAMYTNTQIDELVQGAKDYADANDADTKYGITYDSENKKIKLVEGGSEAEIDATDFIKDGMIETVALSEDGLSLVITWNTDSGKGENNVTTIPLSGLVDVYTGVSGDRVTVSVSSDNKVSAELVAGSISKNYLDDGVQASLAKADSALQEHQDIGHLATEADLTLAEERIAVLEAIDHNAYKAYADQAEEDAIASAKEYADGLNTAMDTRVKVLEAIDHDAYKAYADQSETDAIATAKAYTDELANGAVATNTADIATLTQTVSDNATAADNAVSALEEKVYTKTEVDALIEEAQSWGSF